MDCPSCGSPGYRFIDARTTTVGTTSNPIPEGHVAIPIVVRDRELAEKEENAKLINQLQDQVAEEKRRTQSLEEALKTSDQVMQHWKDEFEVLHSQNLRLCNKVMMNYHMIASAIDYLAREMDDEHMQMLGPLKDFVSKLTCE